MLAKLLPVILLIVGTGAGVGAGIMLRKPPEPDPELHAEDADYDTKAEHKDAKAKKKPKAKDEEEVEREYVKLNNQFVVPIVSSDRIAALVVVSLSLETALGMKEQVFAREPKLRDVFLRVLFDHANIGGFGGAFTQADTMEALRGALRDAAQAELGDGVSDVLIVDIARQDA